MSEVELGFDKSGTGPSLVLIHGFPFDRRMWAHQLDELSEIRTVVAPDLRGRGLSPATAEDGWTLDDYADDVARLIRSLGDAVAVDVGGLSMGGAATVNTAFSRPDLFRYVVILSAGGGANLEEAYPKFFGNSGAAAKQMKLIWLGVGDGDFLALKVGCAHPDGRLEGGVVPVDELAHGSDLGRELRIHEYDGRVHVHRSARSVGAREVEPVGLPTHPRDEQLGIARGDAVGRGWRAASRLV